MNKDSRDVSQKKDFYYEDHVSTQREGEKHNTNKEK
jgi:hypothetical protein